MPTLQRHPWKTHIQRLVIVTTAALSLTACSGPDGPDMGNFSLFLGVLSYNVANPTDETRDVVAWLVDEDNNIRMCEHGYRLGPKASKPVSHFCGAAFLDEFNEGSSLITLYSAWAEDEPGLWSVATKIALN